VAVAVEAGVEPGGGAAAEAVAGEGEGGMTSS
jgi:hypothetical protein